MEEPMTHPPATKLDALAAGDVDAEALLHLEACEACRAYVADLRAGAEAFRANVNAPVFTAALRSRSEEEARAPRPRKAMHKGAKVVWLFVPAVAAAAAVALWMRAP